MKVVVILDTTLGEVKIHYYDENTAENNYNGDVEDYLLGEEVIPNVQNYHWMCVDQLVINTI